MYARSHVREERLRLTILETIVMQSERLGVLFIEIVIIEEPFAAPFLELTQGGRQRSVQNFGGRRSII